MDKEALRADGARLRDARVAANMTLQELANASGIGWNTIQAIEVSRTPGALVDKMKLADALRMSFRDLFPATYAETGKILASGRGKLDGRSRRKAKAAK
jgi:transcriptional regulator with XRE-family HTH domain